jgi:hypothetical protein
VSFFLSFVITARFFRCFYAHVRAQYDALTRNDVFERGCAPWAAAWKARGEGLSICGCGLRVISFTFSSFTNADFVPQMA